MPASFMRRYQIGSSGGSHCPWIGIATLAFTAAAVSAISRAPRSSLLGVPVVITSWLMPSSRTAASATSATCSGVLRTRVRPSSSDCSMAQNWQDWLRSRKRIQVCNRVVASTDLPCISAIER